ncbi:hypothetical protein ACWC9T_37880, partial [Kitasatospora sp. NPDC001159]
MRELIRIPPAEFNSRACAGIPPKRSEGVRCPAACRRVTRSGESVAVKPRLVYVLTGATDPGPEEA